MTRRNLKDNIKKIYDIVLLLISIGIIVAVSMIVYENMQKSIGEQRQYEEINVQMIEKQFNVAETFIYNLVANNTDYLSITAENEIQRNLALGKIRTYMKNETILNNGVYYYFIFDAERNSWISKAGTNGNSGETPYLKEYVKALTTKEEIVGYDWKLCNIHGNDYLLYIYKNDGVYLGAIADVSYLLNDINNYSDNCIFLRESSQDKLQASRENKKEDGWMFYQGKLYYSFCTRLEKTNIYLVTYCAVKHIMTGFGWIVFIVLALCIVAILPGVLFQRHINNTVIVPIDKIAENMEKIKAGVEVSELEDVKSEYVEIQELNRTLKDMLIKIYGLEQVKLDYLHLQANPHFLLNGLNMLYTLLERKKETELTGYVMMLVKHMRFMIHLKEKTIPLKSEMDFTKNYVNLYQKRVPFQIQLTVEGDDAYEDMQVLPYSIQTIVENCVKYGMSEDGNIYIFIQVEQQDNQNIIQISDKGKGINSKIAEMIEKDQRVVDEYGKEHIGLYNVKSRMQMIWGEEARFEISNIVEGGTKIQMSWKQQ